MTTKYTKHFQTRNTPQSQPIPGTAQVENSAGGYCWAVDDWKRLDRFLILGCEGESYYASEKKLTVENAEAVAKCIKENAKRVVERVVEISDAGRAPKNDPALFVLAMVAGMGDKEGKKFALDSLQKVARIGTHLFTFIEYVESFRRWSRQLRTAVGKWYLDKPIDALAYQVLKYQQRNGWSHKDVLRLSHPKPVSPQQQAIFGWVTKGTEDDNLPDLVNAFVVMQKADVIEREIIEEIKANKSITFEMIPTKFLKSAEVWRELLPNLPMTALIRNLGRMTANELLKPMSKEAGFVASKLTNAEFIKKARIHPIAVLSALMTYSHGKGQRGKLSWEPVGEITDALDSAFYLAFGNVEPANKRIVLALDVSGSMDSGSVSGVIGLTPRVASSALAMVTARTEKQHVIVAFCDEMVEVDITPKERLDDVCRKTDELRFGGTDCALPMIWALKKRIQADAFVVLTDNETWAGQIHPVQALNNYRHEMGIPARLVVCGMVANSFSIADPDDSGMFDVVGFDAATPNLIANFIRE